MSTTALGNFWVPGVVQELPVFSGTMHGEDLVLYWTTASNFAYSYRNPSDWSTAGAGGTSATVTVPAGDVAVHGTIKTFSDIIDPANKHVVQPLVTGVGALDLTIAVTEMDGTNTGPTAYQTYSGAFTTGDIVRRLTATSTGVEAYTTSATTGNGTLRTFTYSGAPFSTVNVQTTLAPNVATLIPEFSEATSTRCGRDEFYAVTPQANGALRTQVIVPAVDGSQTTVTYTTDVDQYSATDINADFVRTTLPFQLANPAGSNIFSLVVNTSGNAVSYISNRDNNAFADTTTVLAPAVASVGSSANIAVRDMSPFFSTVYYPHGQYTASIQVNNLAVTGEGAFATPQSVAVMATGGTATALGFSESDIFGVGGDLTAWGASTSLGTSDTALTGLRIVEGTALSNEFYTIGEVQGNGHRQLTKQSVTTAPPISFVAFYTSRPALGTSASDMTIWTTDGSGDYAAIGGDGPNMDSHALAYTVLANGQQIMVAWDDAGGTASLFDTYVMTGTGFTRSATTRSSGTALSASARTGVVAAQRWMLWNGLRATDVGALTASNQQYKAVEFDLGFTTNAIGADANSSDRDFWLFTTSQTIRSIKRVECIDATPVSSTASGGSATITLADASDFDGSFRLLLFREDNINPSRGTYTKSGNVLTFTFESGSWTGTDEIVQILTVRELSSTTNAGIPTTTVTSQLVVSPNALYYYQSGTMHRILRSNLASQDSVSSPFVFGGQSHSINNATPLGVITNVDGNDTLLFYATNGSTGSVYVMAIPNANVTMSFASVELVSPSQSINMGGSSNKAMVVITEST